MGRLSRGTFTGGDMGTSGPACLCRTTTRCLPKRTSHNNNCPFLGDLRWVVRFGLKRAKSEQAKSKHLQAGSMKSVCTPIRRSSNEPNVFEDRCVFCSWDESPWSQLPGEKTRANQTYGCWDTGIFVYFWWFEEGCVIWTQVSWIRASQIKAHIVRVYEKYVYTYFMVKMRINLRSLGLFWFNLDWGQWTRKGLGNFEF